MLTGNTIIVAGTDTGIGKTIFAAALAVAIDAHYWKPVQAGLEDGGDAATIARLGVPASRIVPEAYRFRAACSPHRAAELEHVAIDPARLMLPACEGPLVVEGAGGILVPIVGKLLFADLFARWNKPVVLVARTDLGTINHSLLSIEALRARHVPILGIAFVGEPVENSELTIAELGRVRRLGRLPKLPDLNAGTLARAFSAAFDPKDFELPPTI